MTRETRTLVGWGVFFVALIALVIGAASVSSKAPGELDGFASCIAEKGTTFFGAYWCPHCQEQKAMFGRSAKKLPYVECSLPGGQGQVQQCIDEGIQSYPTWEFADGERISKTLSLAELSEKTGCALPGADAASAPTDSASSSSSIVPISTTTP